MVAVTMKEVVEGRERLYAEKQHSISNKALKLTFNSRPDIFVMLFEPCLVDGVFSEVCKRDKLVLLPKVGKSPCVSFPYRSK